MKIAQCRDPKAVEANLVQSLLDILDNAAGAPALNPPDFTRHGLATSYDEEQFTKMKWLASNGADLKDRRIRELLCWKDLIMRMLGWDFHIHKRVMLLSVYDTFKDIGFNFRENDCILIDFSDVRTHAF